MQSAATEGGVYPLNGTGSNSSEMATTTTTTTTSSRTRDLGLRAQKKLLDRFAATSTGRSLLIDDTTASLLDNLYRLMERSARSSLKIDKKQPEKVLKNIVKLSIKIGLLHRNHQLVPGDAAKMDEIRRALRATAMAVLSFYELEFSYERAFMVKSLERCRSAVQTLIKPHLTDKSHDRCDQVFDFLVHPDFLEAVFGADSELRSVLGMLVNDINKAIENGQL